MTLYRQQRKLLHVAVFLVVVVFIVVTERRGWQSDQSKNFENRPVSQEPDLLDKKEWSSENVRSLIEGFGNPTEDDLRWIKNDPRRKDFLLSIQKNLGTDIHQETALNLIRGMEMTLYRQDMLDEEYWKGDIDMSDVLLGMQIVSEMDDRTVQALLNDDQYIRLMGFSKEEFVYEIDQNDPLFMDGDYAFIWSSFPAIRSGMHPEVRSIQDVYKVVPKDVIEKIENLSKENDHRGKQITHAFYKGEISEKEYESASRDSYESLDASVRQNLSSEQFEFLFGSDR